MRTVLRLLRRVAITAVVLLVLVIVGGGAYYSQQLLPAQGPFPITRDVVVVGDGNGTITLDASEAQDYEQRDATSDGIFGFQTVNGYAQVTGPAQAVTDTGATREFRLLTGLAPTAPDGGQLQAAAFPDDPEILGREVLQVQVPGELGDHPAWFFPASRDEVVIFVHGRGATRAESLRGVQIATSLGYQALVITYRNDGIAPPTTDGYGRFGSTEWVDLDDAASYARNVLGASELIVFAHSQGASLTASWLRNGDTTALDRVILDSPLLSIQETLVLQAEERGIPSILVPAMLTVTKAIADVQGDLDFSSLEHVESAEELGDVPILLFHGRDDTAVPFGPSQELADTLGDQVTFVPYDGDHVRGWNLVNQEYVAAVRDFLSS